MTQDLDPVASHISESFLGQFRFRVISTTRPVFFPITSRFLFVPIYFRFFPYYRPIYPYPPFPPPYQPYPPLPPYPPVPYPLPRVEPTSNWRFRVIFYVNGVGQCSSEVSRFNLTESQAAFFMDTLFRRWSQWPPPRPSECAFSQWPPNCVRVEAYQQSGLNSWILWRAFNAGPGPCP